jgi:hypothetical protein
MRSPGSKRRTRLARWPASARPALLSVAEIDVVAAVRLQQRRSRQGWCGDGASGKVAAPGALKRANPGAARTEARKSRSSPYQAAHSPEAPAPSRAFAGGRRHSSAAPPGKWRLRAHLGAQFPEPPVPRRAIPGATRTEPRIRRRHPYRGAVLGGGRDCLEASRRRIPPFAEIDVVAPRRRQQRRSRQGWCGFLLALAGSRWISLTRARQGACWG